MSDCGGCRGLGAHERYCRAVAGLKAHTLNRWAEQAESLGDLVGSNNFEASNSLYRAAGLLHEDARRARLFYVSSGELAVMQDDLRIDP